MHLHNWRSQVGRDILAEFQRFPVNLHFIQELVQVVSKGVFDLLFYLVGLQVWIAGSTSRRRSLAESLMNYFNASS